MAQRKQYFLFKEFPSIPVTLDLLKYILSVFSLKIDSPG